MSEEGGEENWPFEQLFAPVEKIFAEFDRLFNTLPGIFSIPSEENNSTNLRDEVLKHDEQRSSKSIDENLDARLSEGGWNGMFNFSSSSSSSINRLERTITPSGACLIEREIEQSTDQPIKETTKKICGEKHHTTVKVNGQIVREFGNATLEQLNQIDSNSKPFF